MLRILPIFLFITLYYPSKEQIANKQIVQVAKNSYQFQPKREAKKMVRIAKIKVDSLKITQYNAALKEQMTAAMKK